MRGSQNNPHERERPVSIGDKFVALGTAPHVVAQIDLHPCLQPQTQAYPAPATRAHSVRHDILQEAGGLGAETVTTRYRQVIDKARLVLSVNRTDPHHEVHIPLRFTPLCPAPPASDPTLHDRSSHRYGLLLHAI